MFKAALNQINARPQTTAWGGTISGWITVDLLQKAQFVAAILAGLVSICALIISVPKAIREVRSWFSK